MRVKPSTDKHPMKGSGVIPETGSGDGCAFSLVGQTFTVPASHVAPALEGLRLLEGEWEMEIAQASFVPEGESVRGEAVFEFIEDGRLLAFRRGTRRPGSLGVTIHPTSTPFSIQMVEAYLASTR